MYLPEITVRNTKHKTNKTQLLAILPFWIRTNKSRILSFTEVSQYPIFAIFHMVLSAQLGGGVLTRDTPFNIKARDALPVSEEDTDWTKTRCT